MGTLCHAALNFIRNTCQTQSRHQVALSHSSRAAWLGPSLKTIKENQAARYRDWFFPIQRIKLATTPTSSSAKLPLTKIHFTKVKMPANKSNTAVGLGYLSITTEVAMFSVKSNNIPHSGTRFACCHKVP